MVRIDIFGKDTCELCGHTKRKLAVLLERWGCNGQVQLKYWDMGTVDGLAEAAMNDVMKTPTTIVTRDGKTLARWEAQVPDSRDLKLCIDGNGG